MTSTPMPSTPHTDKAYKIVRAGRRYVLQVFRVSPGLSPVCLDWQRITARGVPQVRRMMRESGVPELVERAS